MAPKKDSQLCSALQQLHEAQTCSEYNACLSDISAALSGLCSATKDHKSSPATLQKLSIKWAPSLIEILKVALARLSEGAVGSTSTQALASIYEQGIIGLEVFRRCLSGRAIELELHRHAVVCKLIAHQHYNLAGKHACRLLAALSRQLADEDESPQQDLTGWATPDSIPALRSDADHDTAQLVVVTATNMVLCSLHAQDESLEEELPALPAFVEQLQPWLRRLPEAEQRRQQDLLSKYLSKAALLQADSSPPIAKADPGSTAVKLGNWAIRAATAACVPKRTSQVYACLAEKLPQEACQALLSSVLEREGDAAAENDSAAWDTAEAMWVVETAAAVAHKTGGSAQLAGLLRNAMQRAGHAYMWLHAFQAAALAVQSAERGEVEDVELAKCLQTAACHLRRLLADPSGTNSTCHALLTAVLQSLHALQKALAPLPTGLHSSVLPAAAEGLQLAPLVHKVLEGMESDQETDQVPGKAKARRQEQAGACLAAVASARAAQALRAAAEVRRSSGCMACTSGRADSSAAADGRRSSAGGTCWGRARRLMQEAVQHMDVLLCAEGMSSGVRQACLASCAPETAELRFLAALHGQHELQARVDTLCADSWSLQPSPASLHSALGGCQLAQMLCPELTTALPDQSSQLGSGQTGQQLRALAADSATKPLQDLWHALRRGWLHLLAAAQLQREGDLVQALAEAAEALRHSGAALHSTQTSPDQAPGAAEREHTQVHFATGGSAPGTWQATWQYVACLLRCGELYEQLGAWEDAFQAFKEGLLMAQSMDALALEAVFSVCQADIYAKQHSFARATALLDAAERPQACSPSMQLCIAARASAVRAAVHRLQGDPRGATQHCQAGVQLASRALQTVLQSSGGKVLPIGQDPAKRRSKQGAGRSTGAAAQSSASASHSAAAEQKPGERGGCDRSVPVSAWHVRSQLAQSHASMAELSWEAGDSEGARNCLQAARTACCDPMPGAGDASEAFPIQTAAVLYQESMYQLEQHEQAVDGTIEASKPWCLQSPTHPPASSAMSTSANTPAGRHSQRGRRKRKSAKSDESPAEAAVHATAALGRLLTAWRLGKAMPSLSRRIAGALALLLGRMGLPHAAALFAHASLGAAVTAQYAAIAQSRLAAQQRRAARAARAADPADAAAEAVLCSRLLDALQPESFSAETWAAAAAGRELDLALLEAEARAHFDRRLSTFPEGMPVVTLSALPARPDQWLLTRCVRGQTPQMIQVQAAGENAEEELAALLEESGASMHTQKESRAEKAAWWRTRIALDGRLQHLCAALETRLGPWLLMLLGQPASVSGHSKSILMTTARACITDTMKGTASGLSPAALDVLTTVMLGYDCLAEADMAASVSQVLSAAGCELDDAGKQSIAARLRTLSREAVGSRQSAAGAALQDISNRQHTAAEAAKAPTPCLKAERHNLYTLSAASEEAQSCLRSAPAAPWAGHVQEIPPGDDWAGRDGSHQIRQHEHSAAQLMSVAEEEADCILRATTRRAARTSSGNQTSSKAAAVGCKQAERGEKPYSRATAGSVPSENCRPDDISMSDAEADISSNRALTRCAHSASQDELVQSTACSTPGPHRRMQMLQDDVEADSDGMDCMSTPVLAMTARRKGRFAAMQSMEAPATALRPSKDAAVLATSAPVKPGAAAGALPSRTPHAPLRKDASRRRVAFAEELHASAAVGGQSSARRGRKACAAPARKSTASAARAEVDQSLHSRTPFKIHRAPLEELDTSVGSLGTRLHAMSLGADPGQQAPSNTQGVKLPADAPLQRGPVLLILDERLQCLPWESLPALRSQRVYRSPSLACACATALRNQSTAPGADGPVAAAGAPAVDARDAVYMLNPSGDLPHTQDTFLGFFQQQPGWQGSVGAPGLASTALSDALRQRSLFVYCGHGAGQQHLPGRALRRQRACAASLLMGCSSGRLARSGQHYEPSGPILAYLLAGCPVAIGNLWDVTDRDIDRFAMTLLETWLSKGKGEGSVQEAQAQQEPGDTAHGAERLLCISRSVSDSRSVCRLPHLIGAAPVCYGVPTSILLQ